MSRKYLVTGSASGIGAATVDKLRADGHAVIGVDIHNAEIVVDLGTAEGRADLLEKAGVLSEGVLDGVIAVAGIASQTPATVAVNYFGAIATLEGLRALLAGSAAPRAVVVGSLGSLADIDDKLLDLLLEGDETAVFDYIGTLDLSPDPDGLPSSLYTTSKRAIARWVRREAAKPGWADAGIALNTVAPGIINTPLSADVLSSPGGLAAISAAAPAPFNGPAAPASAVANLLAWLASDDNLFVTGQVIYADGGAESIYRPELV